MQLLKKCRKMWNKYGTSESCDWIIGEFIKISVNWATMSVTEIDGITNRWRGKKDWGKGFWGAVTLDWIHSLEVFNIGILNK